MWRALESGVAGALTLTALHESARRAVESAPRMDVLGERAITRSLEAMGSEAPDGDRLHKLALAGDVTVNSLYYSMVGLGRRESALGRGAALGLIAGVGAVALPGPMGLGEAPSNRSVATQAMTIAWYTLGGLAAGAVYSLLASERRG